MDLAELEVHIVDAGDELRKVDIHAHAIGPALGAVLLAALLEAPLLTVESVIAFDASPAGKQAVFEKKLFDSPQQFPRKMAKGTVDAFIAYLNGEEVPKDHFIPCAHYYYEDAVKDDSRVAEQW